MEEDKKKEKNKPRKSLENRMFHRHSFYLLAALVISCLTFITVLYFDQVKGEKCQPACQADISPSQQQEQYQKQVNQLINQYQDSLAQYQDNFWSVDSLAERRKITSITLASLLDLKVNNSLKDFHLNLLLALEQIQQSEEQNSLEIYQQAEGKLQSLSDDSQWFNYQ